MYSFLKGRLTAVRLILIFAALVLIAIGIAAIYSVGHPAESDPEKQTSALSGLWKKQLFFTAIACLGFIIANMVNYRRLGTLSFWIYAFVLLLLVVVLVGKYIAIPFVPMINGTHRWIRFSIAGRQLPAIQPSEFCKLAYILALAWYLRYRSNYSSFKTLIGPFVLTLLPMVLILLEPDLGTVILMMPILFVMLFIAGARVKHLLIIIVMAAMVSPVLWFQMRPYQRTRITSVFLQNQWLQQKTKESPLLAEILVGGKFSVKRWRSGAGYHLIRSKYAIASGGLEGYGFREGPFIRYNFLPERQNDFIFAVIAHQWGFAGCAVVLLAYVIIIACGLEIAINNTDPFARLLASGIIAMFAVEVLVNISMTLGLMPITGLTLPLISYGGSSLLVCAIALGLLNNIGRCRRFTVAPK